MGPRDTSCGTDALYCSPMRGARLHVLTAACVTGGLSLAPSAWAVRPQEGRPAPSIRLENLSGRWIDLASLRGRAVVLVFGNGRIAGERCRAWGNRLRSCFAADPRVSVL